MITENIIKKAIVKINDQLPKSKKVIYKSSFPIFGKKSKLDSLTIVNLFFEIENKIKINLKKKITILNDDFFNKMNDNFTILDLIKKINTKLKK